MVENNIIPETFEFLKKSFINFIDYYFHVMEYCS